MTAIARRALWRPRFSLVAGLWLLGLVPLLAAAAPPARAQDNDVFVQGTWAVVIERARRGCVWRGRIRLVQRGSQIKGSGWAHSKNQSAACPRLQGKVEGSVSGPLVRFGFATGRIGTARFEGIVGGDSWTMKGDWFAGRRTGDWSARKER